jgi:hypothetical protein
MSNNIKMPLLRSTCRLTILIAILLTHLSDGLAWLKIIAWTPPCDTWTIDQDLALCYTEAFCRDTANPNQNLAKIWV